MNAEGSVKHEQIIEAAIKRFSHFGINKTTLSEIADDLAISKPSLFYYFHDKNSLIAAVAEKIIHETLEDIERSMTQADTIEKGLHCLVEIKRKYFQKYYLLAIQGESADIAKVSSTLPGIYQYARTKMEALLSTLLNKGIEQNILRPIDTLKTSLVLLDTLSAFEYCMKSRKGIPDIKDINEMFNRQKDVLDMFLNGLKREPNEPVPAETLPQKHEGSREHKGSL